MDFDYAIRKDEPSAITMTNTPDVVRLYEQWERSNRLYYVHKDTYLLAYVAQLRSMSKSGIY